MKLPLRRILLLLLIATIGFAPTLRADVFHYAGTIATGAQYDLYTISLPAHTRVVADLVCAPPPDNTLDTILTLFAPGADTSDTANATFYNDDGGTADCGGFHSSRLDVIVDTGGDWTFRVDGFGSAVGDYTLDIVTSDASIVAIPTLDGVGLTLLVLMLSGAALFVMRRQRRA